MEVVLGTMTFGPRCDQQQTREILDVAAELGVTELDTAILYGAGVTEEILGSVGAGQRFTVATKVNPFTSPQPVEVGLSPEAIERQFSHSLQSLKVDSVDMLYLHAPDHAVPIEETLAAVDKLHKAGKFKRFGLSNYAAWEVADIVHICRNNGFVQPSVYQGMYNAVTRAVEPELFPALRRFGIAFYAYNPLAGGLLAGVHRRDEEPAEGRFNTTTFWGKAYRSRYWKDELFDVVEQLKKTCAEHSITCVEAAHRWLVHHSKMDASKGDKVIVGASSIEHARSNISACQQGPLPQAILEVFDQGWQAHKPSCPAYNR